MRVLPYLLHVYPTCITEDMNIHEHTEARTRNMRKRTLALFFFLSRGASESLCFKVSPASILQSDFPTSASGKKAQSSHMTIPACAKAST